MRISDWSSDVCASDLLTADVHYVRSAGEQWHELRIMKGGRHNGEVGQVAGGFPRIVGHVAVAVDHGFGRKCLKEVLDRRRHRVDVAGRAGDRDRKSTRLNSSH